ADTAHSSTSWTMSEGIEILVLTGAESLSGTGNAASNTIVGNAGDNTLDGGAGADELIGGAGDDIYIVDNVGDQIVEGSAEGTADEVRATVDYVLSANVENLV